jgi:hypothetical protein
VAFEAAGSWLATSTVTEVDDETKHHDDADRPRCLRCGHPLKVTRSLARAYGPKCWRRTAIGQLEAQRDAVGRLLGRVGVRVSSLDGPRLSWVSDALEDLLLLDAEVA